MSTAEKLLPDPKKLVFPVDTYLAYNDENAQLIRKHVRYTVSEFMGIPSYSVSVTEAQNLLTEIMNCSIKKMVFHKLEDETLLDISRHQTFDIELCEAFRQEVKAVVLSS